MLVPSRARQDRQTEPNRLAPHAAGAVLKLLQALCAALLHDELD